MPRRPDLKIQGSPYMKALTVKRLNRDSGKYERKGMLWNFGNEIRTSLRGTRGSLFVRFRRKK